MKILVLGAKGVLGREVCCSALNMGHDTYWPDKDKLDITNSYDIHEFIQRFRPGVVINCAGLVKSREATDVQFITVNGLAPQWIADECDIIGAKLLQISTDCVFSGTRGGFYSERDIPDPSDIYGKSKYIGEVVREPHLTIRTSFIGFGDRGLLAWLLNQKGKVPGYKDSYWNGVTSVVLARVLMSLIDIGISGLLHIHSNRVISKAELLSRIVDYLGLDVEVEPCYAPEEYRVNRSLVSMRQVYDKYTVPSMSQMLEELALINDLLASK